MVADALSQAWPPFVLVTGLLMIGAVAHHDGLFARAGGALGRLPGPPLALFGTAAGLVVVVTAVLNLDTAVVFLTPVLVLTARRRGLDEEPFLYAAVFMANASSLFLPGSNLTNLIVLAEAPEPGGRFAADLFPAAAAAVLVTLGGLALLFRRRLRAGAVEPSVPDAAPWGGPGLVAALVAAALTVALQEPALPVLAVGVLAVLFSLGRGLRVRTVLETVSPAVLAGVFSLAVALGVLARAWDGPAGLVAGSGRLATAALGAGASVLVNNLPAAVLLSAQDVPHPQALLVGLNLGPNLAVTGSLSAYLWFQAARQVGARPSVLAFSRRGVLLAPAAIAAALLLGSG